MRLSARAAGALAALALAASCRRPPPPPPNPCGLEAGGIDLARDVVPPRKTKDVLPVYPDAARDAGKVGNVVVQFTITPAGRTDGVKVKEGVDPVLDQAAVEAVRQWEYTPSLVRGTPCPTLTAVTVRFLAATPP